MTVMVGMGCAVPAHARRVRRVKGGDLRRDEVSCVVVGLVLRGRWEGGEV